MAKKSKKNKKDPVPRNEKSTRDTFLKWLEECGNDLMDYDGLLSCSGSDGPTISKDNLDGIPFNCPEAIEEYLIEEEYYVKQMVIMGTTEYNPPTVHYIDWLNK